MTPCINHPSVAAAGGCALCQRPFCASCLVPVLGQYHCGVCKDISVARMQGATGLVYNSARRFRNASVIALCQIVLFLLPPAIGGIVAALLPAELLWLKWVVGIMGIAAGIALPILALQRLFVLGNATLRHDIAQKVSALGVPEAVAAGQFVGLSPQAARAQYDGETDWDVGFLLVRPGWLAYYGDRCWFCLRPDQVTRMVVDPERPGLLAETRLLVHWQDAPSSRTGVASFTTRDVIVRSDLRPAVQALAARLEAWRTNPVPVEASQMPLPPEAPQTGPNSVLAGTEPGAWKVQLAVGIPMAIVAAVVGAVIEKTTGTDFPMPLMVGGVVVGSALVAQAIVNRRKNRGLSG